MQALVRNAVVVIVNVSLRIYSMSYIYNYWLMYTIAHILYTRSNEI